MSTSPFTKEEIEKFRQAKLSKIQKEYGNCHLDFLTKLVNEAMDDKPSKLTGGYPKIVLEMAFDMIKPLENWKMPIDAIIDRKYFDVCSEAAIFYTGCSLTIDQNLEGFKVRVSAPGYYNTIGA